MTEERGQWEEDRGQKTGDDPHQKTGVELDQMPVNRQDQESEQEIYQRTREVSNERVGDKFQKTED